MNDSSGQRILRRLDEEEENEEERKRHNGVSLRAVLWQNGIH